MRLSDIKGDKVLDVTADLIEPMCNIAETEEIKRWFTSEKIPEGMTAQEFGLKKIRSNVPALIRHCKKDIITVLAILDDKDPAVYEQELNMIKLLRDVTALISDPVLMGFFLSVQREVETSSGAAPETTTAAKD